MRAPRLAPVALLALALVWPAAAQADINVGASGTVVTITGNDDANSVFALAANFGADVSVSGGEVATATAPCQVQSFGVVRCLLGGPVSRMEAVLPGPLADTFDKAINSAARDLIWDLDVDFGDNAGGIDVTRLSAPGLDAVDAGPGTDDVVTYRFCACASGVTAQLDGVAGDDTLVGVEHVTGSGGADRLTGRDGEIVPNPTVDDTEVIDGGDGADIIEGRRGRDFLNAEGGDDLVLAADGELDGISCGEGVDRAIVDPVDTHDGSCEVINLGHDRDGDALLDEWEEHGFDADGDGVPEVDLPAMGANPDRKDVFVEIDAMSGHRLDQQTMAMVIDAFTNAPVPSLNGALPGIALHVDNGPDSVMNPVTGEAWGARSNQNELTHVEVLGTEDGDGRYNWDAFRQIKATNLLVDRRPLFHYVIAAHRGPSSFVGISNGIEASDVLLTLGGPGAAENAVSREFAADTFMHELGHNLGLRHGGADNINHKPNYLSIMSYGHGGAGLLRVDGTQVIDYSRFAIPLDENALDEPNGFGLSAGSPPTAFATFFKCPDGKVGAALFSGAVDWTCNGNIFASPVTVNVSGADGITVLESQTDWDKLVYDGGLLGNKALPAATEIGEPSVEEIAERDAAVRAALAPTVAPPPPPAGQPVAGTPTVPAPGAPSRVTPRLTALRLTPGRFRPARRGGTVVRRGGVKIAYRLDRAVAVTFTVQRRTGRRWTRVAGSFKQAGKAGVNTLRFSGRLAGKRLRPGRYRLVATPRGGAAARAQFTARR